MEFETRVSMNLFTNAIASSTSRAASKFSTSATVARVLLHTRVTIVDPFLNSAFIRFSN